MAGPKADAVRQDKKPQRHPTAAQVEDALRKAAGNVTAAAKGLGIGRTALHRRIARSPQLQQALQEEREALVDMAESALRAEVLARNMTAVIWTLKASPEAKRRGWGERTELTGAEGGPVQVQNDDGQTDEQRREKLAALSRIAAFLAEGGDRGAGNGADDDPAG